GIVRAVGGVPKALNDSAKARDESPIVGGNAFEIPGARHRGGERLPAERRVVASPCDGDLAREAERRADPRHGRRAAGGPKKDAWRERAEPSPSELLLQGPQLACGQSIRDSDFPRLVPAFDRRLVDSPIGLFEPTSALASQPVEALPADRLRREPAFSR